LSFDEASIHRSDREIGVVGVWPVARRGWWASSEVPGCGERSLTWVGPVEAVAVW
jgi:hypothetical protein